MEPLRFDHVTAIVPDADALSRVLATVVGVEPASAIALAGMRILTFQLGAVELHVNQPIGPGPVADALDRAGPHLHHVALSVTDLDATLERLRAAGIETLGAPVETAPGLREVFLRPALTAGLYVQLVERRRSEVTKTLDGEAVAALANAIEPHDEEVSRR